MASTRDPAPLRAPAPARAPRLLVRLEPRHHRVHDRAPEDRQPGPREEHRPDVVALDRGVLVRGREEAGGQHRDARQQRVPRVADHREQEPRRHEDHQEAELGEGEVDDVADLARHVGQRPGEVALELAGQHDVPEPAPRLGMPVDERRAEETGAERQLEVQQRRHAEAGAQRGQDDARPPHDPGLDREHEQPDGRDQQQREPVVRQRHAEHRGGQHDPAVGPGAQARVVGRLAPVARRVPPSAAAARRWRRGAPRAARGRPPRPRPATPAA